MLDECSTAEPMYGFWTYATIGKAADIYSCVHTLVSLKNADVFKVLGQK